MFTKANLCSDKKVSFKLWLLSPIFSPSPQYLEAAKIYLENEKTPIYINPVTFKGMTMIKRKTCLSVKSTEEKKDKASV